MPDWVHVWFWLRFLRFEQVMTSLPQQGVNPTAMSMDQYLVFEDEWESAGAPQTTAKQVLAVMGAAVKETDDIPF